MIFMYIFDKQSIIFHVIRICTCVHEAGENKIPAYKQIHETESSRKERNSNLELYRIIVMLLIVAHHYVVNSGLMSSPYFFIYLECGGKQVSIAL